MPQRSLYPALNKLRAGNSVGLVKPPDAIGRRVLRVDQEKKRIGDLRSPVGPGATGGTPQVRGPEHMVPHLLEAAQRLRLPPSQATSPAVMQRIRSLGGVSQRMAGTLRTSDPRQQALSILRRGAGPSNRVGLRSGGPPGGTR